MRDCGSGQERRQVALPCIRRECCSAHTASLGKDPGSEFQVQSPPNAYRFHTIVRLRNCKWGLRQWGLCCPPSRCLPSLLSSGFSGSPRSLKLATVRALGAGVRNLPANARHARQPGSVSGSGRSPGVGNGNPLQHSCLENLGEESDTTERLSTRECLQQGKWEMLKIKPPRFPLRRTSG